MSCQKKIIVFDFDKTLTINDSLIGFFMEFPVRYRLAKIICYRLVQAMCWSGIISNSTMKNIGLRVFVKGCSDIEIDRISSEYSKKIQFSKLREKVVAINNARIFVVTASFECYVKYCFGTSVVVIGSRLEHKFGLPQLQFNCYGNSKVEALKKIGVARIDELYTDSVADSPLGKISKAIYLVNNGSVKKVDSL
jgi:phosphoserine phosphatase